MTRQYAIATFLEIEQDGSIQLSGSVDLNVPVPGAPTLMLDDSACAETHGVRFVTSGD